MAKDFSFFSSAAGGGDGTKNKKGYKMMKNTRSLQLHSDTPRNHFYDEYDAELNKLPGDEKTLVSNAKRNLHALSSG
jgi:hypothetical protein